MGLKRKDFNQCVLPAMICLCKACSLTTALLKKLGTSRRAMERKMLNVKLKTTSLTPSLGEEPERQTEMYT